MANPQALASETAPLLVVDRMAAPTWRYLGDRAEADLAYCARFGTREAPEPIVMRGTWAYALPAPVPAPGA